MRQRQAKICTSSSNSEPVEHTQKAPSESIQTKSDFAHFTVLYV